MRLKRMTLTHFRQFKGEQTIEFPEGEKNITVVFGENGRGKTGLFRALLFALFGDRTLSQDEGSEQGELFLVNRSAVEGSGVAEGGVEVHLVDGTVEYAIKRTIRARKESGGRQQEELGLATLSKTDASGNTSSIEFNRISTVIGKILNQRVKDYFFFDGEKMELLTRANRQQRKEVSDGIRDLLQIDVLDRAIQATKKLTAKLEKESERGASPEYAQAGHELKKQLESKAEKENELDQLSNEISEGGREIAMYDKRLGEIADIKDETADLEDCRSRLVELERGLDEMLGNMRSLYQTGAFLLMKPLVDKVTEHLEGLRRKGEIPSPVQADFIKRILEAGKCICGCELTPGSPQYAELVRWRDNTMASQGTQDSMLNLLTGLSGIARTIEIKSDAIDDGLVQLSTKNSARADLRDNIDELEKLVAGKVHADDKYLPEMRKSCEKKITEATAKRLNIEKEIADIDERIGQLELQRDKWEKEQGIQNARVGRMRLAREANKALLGIQQGFIDDVRKRLGEESTKFFRKLIDPNSGLNHSSLVIEKDFSLQILEAHGDRFLANISQGERQILSMAFIAALATSATEGRMNMPLFMDTPFGRLSFVHRKRLITTISGICSQWILLATDTELRREEAEAILQSGRWEKMYKLSPLADGSTKIESMKPESFVAGLRSAKETGNA